MEDTVEEIAWTQQSKQGKEAVMLLCWACWIQFWMGEWEKDKKKKKNFHTWEKGGGKKKAAFLYLPPHNNSID